MKILALLKPANNTKPADFEVLMVEEERALWSAYVDGPVREMYFQADPLVVSIAVEADSKSDVQSVLDTFPMVQAKLFDIELIARGAWRNFEVLFAEK